MSLVRILCRGLVYHGSPAVQATKTITDSISTRLFSCISAYRPQTLTSVQESRSQFPNYGLSKLLLPTSTSILSVRTYKPKNVLKLRCDGCYFERRKGRLYVECTLKPRHRQMKKMPSGLLYRDDYSKGKIHEACWWKYRADRYYKQGETEFTHFNWLGDRLGKEI